MRKLCRRACIVWAGVGVVLVAAGWFGPRARAQSAWGDLQRRAYLGLAVLPLEAANAMRLGLDEPRGVWVHLLIGGAPALESGLAVDDVVTALNGVDTPGVPEFARAARSLRPGQDVELSIVRAGQEETVHMVAAEAPVEEVPGLRTTLGSFRGWPGVRLRAILTTPDSASSAAPRHPAILLLQDATGPSVEAGGYNPYRELAHRLGSRGYAVLRFDRRGVGDSEGEPYVESDFETEVRDAEAALAYLERRPEVDAQAIYVLGHGTGGVVAAELARNKRLAGILVAGTVGRPWHEFAADCAERTARLGGVTGSELDRTRDVVQSFYSVLERGLSIEEILEEHPEWARVVLDQTGRPFGRNAPFLRQLQSIDFANLYEDVRCPVAVIYGSSDAVATRADADRILESLASGRNDDVSLLLLPRTDHDLAFAETEQESADNWSTGTLAFNPEVVDSLVGWIERTPPAGD